MINEQHVASTVRVIACVISLTLIWQITEFFGGSVGIPFLERPGLSDKGGVNAIVLFLATPFYYLFGAVFYLSCAVMTLIAGWGIADYISDSPRI